MSERKVLTKYYPPDFDPRQIQRSRGPKQVGPKVQTVRLMAPFSMQCTTCGEFIYKGRKFNARKETPENAKYLGIQIFRFYIRCTRCSAEITFKTDPKNGDYACERGAKRNVEPWRQNTAEETDEERLQRLEKEEEERNAMVELEAKTVDAKREMAVADALDEIRTRNARLERSERDGVEFTVAEPEDDDATRQEKEDEEAAKAAFANARQMDAIVDEVLEDTIVDSDMPPPPLPSFIKKTPPVKKKAGPAILGIKKKNPEPQSQPQAPPSKQPEKKAIASLVSYDSDSD
ncbi:putative CWC16 protein [Seiridium unicorne]|uniref:Splicing factor YJU2 n=1 Tax=Seiridium unicorne TaxID=138068 RepID=A0ABR2VHT4_9PEZI